MKLNWAERWVVNNPWMKKTRPIPVGAKIIEIGCGRGAGADLIRKAFQPSSIYALDLDLEMTLKAKAYLSRRDGYGVSLTVGDAFHLPVKDSTMDAVFGFGVLHHLPDWRGGVSEIARILKMGGVYFIEELYPSLYQNVLTKHILLHPKENRFRSHDLNEALESIGLPLVNILEFKKVGILGVAVKTVSSDQ